VIKVAKFGGSSLADASCIKRVIDIVQSDPARRFIVVSAPGERWPSDSRVTNLLYDVQKGGDAGASAFEMLADRFSEIVRELGLPRSLISEHLANLSQSATRRSPDYVASRGEFMTAKIIAAALGYKFLDSELIIRFNDRGQYDEAATAKRMRAWMHGIDRAVIPGFYGTLPDWSIKTFPRGGSDITGAIVARAVKADLYENWTDVSGVLMADPEIVPNPQMIPELTFSEIRELAYMGARIFHHEAVLPVQKAGIPTNVRNTNDLGHPGTMILAAAASKRTPGSIVGIAGRKGFAVMTVTKAGMNAEIGFVRRLCSVFEDEQVSIEHIPGGIDTVSVITTWRELGEKLECIRARIKHDCEPDSINVRPDLAMICTVGEAMAETPGVAAKLLQAVADAKINVRMINQGSSEISIIIGVDNDDADNAVRAIYRAFIDTAESTEGSQSIPTK